VGALIGYVALTVLLSSGLIAGETSQLMWMTAVISLLVFHEVTDLVRERITHYRKLEFFHAMLCCGISERRIINREILWKNSRAHLVNKLVAVFATACNAVSTSSSPSDCPPT
jgi:ABC-type dipeptide/oligopeptide/nickel transport system permease subunit